MIFINFSNHETRTWSDKQLTAAKLYGEIKDLAFPVIPPDWNTDQVEKLAHTYCLDFQNLLNDQTKLTVHIMGESVFCFILIQMLLKIGCQCVASTTERIVEECNEKKIVQFNFKQFRKYKII